MSGGSFASVSSSCSVECRTAHVNCFSSMLQVAVTSRNAASRSSVHQERWIRQLGLCFPSRHLRLCQWCCVHLLHLQEHPRLTHDLGGLAAEAQLWRAVCRHLSRRRTDSDDVRTIDKLLQQGSQDDKISFKFVSLPDPTLYMLVILSLLLGLGSAHRPRDSSTISSRPFS